MLDDQEAVQQLERQYGCSEEIERDDHFAMIGEKCLPALIRLPGSGTQTSQIPGERPLRNLEAKFDSSPCIFGAPQSAFSSLILRMRLRTSSVILGRPPRHPDRQPQ